MRGRSGIRGTLFLLLLLSAMLTPARAAAFEQDPVLLVPGCAFLSPTQAWEAVQDFYMDRYWEPVVERFRDAGYPDDHVHVAMFSEPCGQNRTIATELAGMVAAVLHRTSKAKVDLVGHSMACLSTRLFAATSRQVDDVVEVAGACHGSDINPVLMTALQLNGENPGGADVDPAYDCDGVQKDLNGCFDPVTGARTSPFDETPGTANMRAIYTDTDELVDPFESACIDQSHRNDCSSRVNVLVPGRSHFTLHQQEDVMEMTVAFVRDG